MNERRPVIRHIATSVDGTVIAVAEFERYVQSWDVRHQRRIASFETTLDFGGRRLAISRNGAFCAVGAYHVHGIALDDTGDGRELWRRKDLKKVQRMRVPLDEKRLFCGFEGKAFEILNLNNGRSKTPLRGVDDVWESPYDPLIVHDRKRRDFKLVDCDGKTRGRLPRTTFAALGFAFAPGKLCISESGGPISCFDLRVLRQLWQFSPGQGIHALDIAYNEEAHQFVAVMWPYQHGGQKQHVSFDPDSGSPAAIQPLGNAHEFAFCCKGSILLSSDGRLRDSVTGVVLGELAFFQ